jgi:hypothetical protein
MHIMYAQHDNGVPTSPAMPDYANKISCGSCLLNGKASAAPCNSHACAKQARPLMNLSFDIWGPVNVPSQHCLRYCPLDIDHHTNYLWVKFLKTKDYTCAELETILLEIRHGHARVHSTIGVFTPILKLDSDSVFEASATHLMRSRLCVGVQFLSHTRTTCSGKLNARGARFETMALLWSTTCRCPIPCGHARLARSATFATAYSVVLLDRLVVCLSRS